jgi:sporulation protein YlmC with PRC-barrel domain
VLLSDLLGKNVVSEAGWSFGKVFDLRVRLRDDGAPVVGLVVGREGLAERLLGERVGRPGQATHARPVIPWEDVVRVGRRRVVVREGSRPHEDEATKEAR